MPSCRYQRRSYPAEEPSLDLLRPSSRTPLHILTAGHTAILWYRVTAVGEDEEHLVKGGLALSRYLVAAAPFVC